MHFLRPISWIGLGCGLAALASGSLLAVGSALAAGDWWLAREPWIGWGLALITVGLALTTTFGIVLDLIEPVGWWRLVALPAGVFVALIWVFWIMVGMPTTGPGSGGESDVATILYSAPDVLLIVLVATLLIPLPLLVARIARRGPAPTG